MTTTTTPAPRPLCAAFAPLLPLISSGALEEDEAAPAHEHVAGCAWCQQELARYMAVDEALRRQFGAASENVLPFPFDLDGDEDVAEDYAFTLEDTLEETMAEGTTQQPPTTARSSRWGERKRRPGPRTTAIAGIAAALILAVIATTIYTQFAARRTTAPAATATSGAFTKATLPNANALFGWTSAPDGSFWYANSALSASHSAAIGHVMPDGTITTFPIPPDDTITFIEIHGMAVGSDGNVWFGGYEGRGTTGSTLIWRMTPTGVFTRIALPADVSIGRMISGPDDALWFVGARGTYPETFVDVIGRMTLDGHLTTFPTPSQSKDGGVLYLCVGPDNAIWYTWTTSQSDAAAPITGRIGRVSLSGQIEEFAVPFAPGSIASGADGALWYSEIAANTSGDFPTAVRKGYIGRITTSGVASELPIDPNTRIGMLAAGSDGAIWYTMDGDRTGAFGRITPSGGVKAFSTNGNAPMDLIAAVPGALWLFDSRNNLWHYRLPA